MKKIGCAQKRKTSKEVNIHKKQKTYIIQITETIKNTILFLLK